MIPAAAWSAGLGAAERGWVPDAVLRRAIRALCRTHARELEARDPDTAREELAAFVAGMRTAPVAPSPGAANEQHYEVPPEFFGLVLGARRKYSCALWPREAGDLDAAEEAALAATAAHAGLEDGQRVLELGCGWGSLTLWMAERYPNSEIRAVSNSVPQGEHIRARARERGLENVRVTTADANGFRPEGPYDRVVSVEMFEHLRNWEEILARVEKALAPQGRLFVHHFCHREAAYEYPTDGPADWMGREFFTGGIMPSRDLLHRMESPLAVEEEWTWDGTHYRRTAEAWLANLDARRAEAGRVLAGGGAPDPVRAVARWRMFFLACAELFGLDRGRTWMVGHYRLVRP